MRQDSAVATAQRVEGHHKPPLLIFIGCSWAERLLAVDDVIEQIQNPYYGHASRASDREIDGLTKIMIDYLLSVSSFLQEVPQSEIFPL